MLTAYHNDERGSVPAARRNPSALAGFTYPTHFIACRIDLRDPTAMSENRTCSSGPTIC
jgi:hypothetical protein